jgi:hypothetical protein
VLFIAYAIPALSPVKNAFIGCLFYGTALMVFVWNIGRLLRHFPVPPYAVAAIGLILFVAFWRPVNINTQLNPPMVASEAAHRVLMPPVLQLLSRDDSPLPISVVYVVSIGPVFDATVRYFALKQNLQAQIVSGYSTPTWDEAVKLASLAHIVIVSESGSIGQSEAPFPVTAFQNALMRMLETDPQFRVLRDYSDSRGLRTVAFARHFMPGQVRVTYPSGFREQEGPYPKFGLPTFRWMTAEKGTIILRSEVTVGAMVELRCLAVVPTSLTATVSPESKETVTVELLGGLIASNFRTLRLPVGLEADKPLTLTLLATPKEQLPEGWPASALCSAPLTLLERGR